MKLETKPRTAESIAIAIYNGTKNLAAIAKQRMRELILRHEKLSDAEVEELTQLCRTSNVTPDVVETQANAVVQVKLLRRELAEAVKSLNEFKPKLEALNNNGVDELEKNRDQYAWLDSKVRGIYAVLCRIQGGWPSLFDCFDDHPLPPQSLPTATMVQMIVIKSTDRYGRKKDDKLLYGIIQADPIKAKVMKDAGEARELPPAPLSPAPRTEPRMRIKVLSLIKRNPKEGVFDLPEGAIDTIHGDEAQKYVDAGLAVEFPYAMA